MVQGLEPVLSAPAVLCVSLARGGSQSCSDNLLIVVCQIVIAGTAAIDVIPKMRLSNPSLGR